MSVKNALGYNQFPCPVGSVVYYGGLTNTGTPRGESVPSTFIIANGASLLRTEYVALYNVLGTTFGAVDSAHFSIPDLVTYQYIRGSATPVATPEAGGIFDNLTITDEAYIPTLSSALFTQTSWNGLTANMTGQVGTTFPAIDESASPVEILTGAGELLVRNDSASTWNVTHSGTVSYTAGGDEIPIISTYIPDSLSLVPLIKAWYELIPSPLYQTPVNLGEPVPADNIYLGNPELGGFLI